MKTKVLSIILLSLFLTACGVESSSTQQAATSSAVEKSEINVETSNVIDVSKQKEVKIVNKGAYTLTGKADEVNIQVEANEDVTLILDGLHATNSTQPVLELDSTNTTTIQIKDQSENTITMSVDNDKKGAIDAKGNLVIDGSGSLEVNSKVGHGIKTEQSLTINNGSITILSGSDALKAEGSIVYNDGNLNVTQSTEGIESKDNITVNGGSIRIKATDDAINATNSIVINNGLINVSSSTNDGIDSNGTITINGGSVFTSGAAAPEAGIDSDMNPLIINGGIVVGLGGSNSRPSNDSKQVSLLTNGLSGNITVTDGTTSENITIEDNHSSMLLSMPFFKQGSTIIISSGSQKAEVKLSDVVNGQNQQAPFRR